MAKEYLTLILKTIYIEKDDKIYKNILIFRFEYLDRISDALLPHGVLRSIDH